MALTSGADRILGNNKSYVFEVPHFTSIDLSGKYEFMAALTDGGICHVLNGNSMDATFSSSPRADVLKSTLDERTEDVTPEKIHGTGKLFRKTFWFDVGERYGGDGI